uniref:Uncharacterized protein n=1 Tax=Rhizophora mucronata TaxID=61149 RepID=A0A2P2QYG8_RHIMU
MLEGCYRGNGSTNKTRFP